MLGRAPARGPEHAQRMGLVDHQPGAVLLLQLDEPRQVGDVAVHRIQALDDDERALVEMAMLLKQLLERLQIVVAEGQRRGARQLGADQHAVVGEIVVDDEIVRRQQRADGRDVGGVAADECDRALDP